MLRFLVCSSLAAVLTAAIGADRGAAQVGTAVAVVQTATAATGDARRPLLTGGQVTRGERVDTNEVGRVQLLFSDETKLIVGPGSSLLIDEYVLNAERTVSKFTVNALSGTFRFISGNSDKSAYLIDTPVATIGVRGTGFDAAILPDLTLAISLMEGPIEVCNKFAPRERRCMVLTRTCGLTYFRPDGSIEGERDMRRRNAAWRENFEWMDNQRGIRSGFRLPVYNCGHMLPEGVRSGSREGIQDTIRDEPERRSPPRSEDDEDDGDGGGDGGIG